MDQYSHPNRIDQIRSRCLACWQKSRNNGHRQKPAGHKKQLYPRKTKRNRPTEEGRVDNSRQDDRQRNTGGKPKHDRYQSEK